MSTSREFPISARAGVSDLDRAPRRSSASHPTMRTRAASGVASAARPGRTCYGTPSAGTTENTIAGWAVKDIESVLAGLRERGVTFEEHDFGEVLMVDGLADFGKPKAAWFKHTDGTRTS